MSVKLTALLCALAKWKYCITDAVRHGMLRETPHRTSEEYWNDRAKFYDRQYGRELLLDRLEAIIRGDTRYRRIMELGCGIGGNLRALASRFPQIAFTGLDHSEAMLGKASDNLKAFPNVRLFRADLEELDSYMRERQDLVFSRAVLQHLSPDSVRSVVGGLFERVTDRLYLEELSVRDYPDGRSLRWPGFPEDLYYSHDYPAIVSRYADVLFRRYKRGIVLQLFCAKRAKDTSAG